MYEFYLKKNHHFFDDSLRIVYDDGLEPRRLNKDGKLVYGDEYDTYNSRRYAISIFKKYFPKTRMLDLTGGTRKIIK